MARTHRCLCFPGGLYRSLVPASGSFACVLRASRIHVSVPLSLGLRRGRGSPSRAGGRGHSSSRRGGGRGGPFRGWRRKRACYGGGARDEAVKFALVQALLDGLTFPHGTRGGLRGPATDGRIYGRIYARLRPFEYPHWGGIGLVCARSARVSISATDGSLPLIGDRAGRYSFACNLSGPFRLLFEPAHFGHWERWQSRQFQRGGRKLSVLWHGRRCR